MMNMIINKSISEPIPPIRNWNENWGDLPAGLVTAWNTGRDKIERDPEIAEAARNGQLIPLVWKGGVEKKILKTTKYGSMYYLAMWQGLRGEDLNIDLDSEPSVTCSATGMTVIFTPDIEKLSIV
jgi:hypothetical protein